MPIDQGEELFSVSDAEEATRFFELLSVALEGDTSFLALLVIRSDQLGSLLKAKGPRFEEIFLKPLPLERVGEIIRGPAKLVGIEVEEGLIAAAIKDAATPDALPLLAIALREIYDREGASHRLTVASYANLGDPKAGLSSLENAIRRIADEAIAAESPSDEDLAALRAAFVPALVRVNEEGDYVRRPARMTHTNRPRV